MRRGLRLTVAAAALAALATGLAIGQPVLAAGGTRVLMVDNEPDLTNWHFEPAEVTVPAGSTVVWHNKGKEEHSVRADNKSFDSGYKPKGGNYQRTFTRPGTYAYHCAPHPWMTGVVRVVAATPAAPAPTTATSSAPTTTVTTASPTTTTTVAPPAETTRGPERQDGAVSPESAPSEATTGDRTGAALEAPGFTAAAPASRRRARSVGGLAGTVMIVVGPTLAGLALGAKLRRKET
jgi:plastocyanin